MLSPYVWLHLGGLLAWVVVLGFNTPAACRWLFRKHKQPMDDIWAMMWFCAAWVTCFRLRFLTGFAPVPREGVELISGYGLHVVSIMVAFGFMTTRYRYRGPKI